MHELRASLLMVVDECKVGLEVLKRSRKAFFNMTMTLS